MSEFHQLPTRDIQPSKDWSDLDLAAEARAKSASEALMPNLDHLSLDDYEHVYEPAADTFLLLDALKYEIDQGSFDTLDGPVIALELGCGSGVPSIYFRQELKRRLHEPPISCRVISIVTDINPRALEMTMRTARINGIEADDCFDAIQCDLAGPLLDRLCGMVDVLIFNPPYVPTPDHEVGSTGIEASWAGGTDGRIVIDRALPQLAQLLRPETGCAYMITVDDNRPEDLANTLLELHGLECRPHFRRRARNERLTVQKIRRKTDKGCWWSSSAKVM